MFTNLMNLLLGPHGVDRYTELVDPMWTSQTRAVVVEVNRSTPRTVTLWLRPNRAVSARAGQHVAVTVEIDGRRHTRCYSPASAERSPLIELTVSRHDGGRVSEFLHRAAAPGMVVELGEPAGDFVLSERRPRRILLVAGGSGITPVMSMLRTLRDEEFDGDVAVLRYVRTLDEACYRDELLDMPKVRVLHVCTRAGDGDLSGHFNADHLAAAMPSPEAVYVCGPVALVDAVRGLREGAVSESFTPPAVAAAQMSPGGRGPGQITFSDSAIRTADDGRPLLDQAETAGLRPQSGCRMGICHTCTRRKLRGVVRNLTTGRVSTADDQDVQICVSVPVGDVEIAL